MMLMILCGNVHEFLRNTANVYTGATQAPSRTLRAGTHVVKNGDFEAQSFSFLGAAEPTRASSNHNQVVLVFRVKGQSCLATLAKSQSSPTAEAKHGSTGTSTWFTEASQSRECLHSEGTGSRLHQ